MKKAITLAGGMCLAVFSCFHAVAQAPASDGYKFDNGSTYNAAYVDRIVGRKTKLLEDYFAMLVAKTEPNWKLTIDRAMGLFNNDETRIVEISSNRTNKKIQKHTRVYFNDVAQLPYKKVDVSYRNYSKIENIRRQPDGTYRGFITMEMEFDGVDKEGNIKYKDVTRKQIEVVVKITESLKDGRLSSNLDVFFGNMGVIDTRS